MKWGCLIFSLVGLGFLTGGYFTYSNTKSFISTASEATGEVTENQVSYSRDSNGRQSTSYYPTVTFLTKENESITFKSKHGSNPPAYSRGEEVSVFYDAQQPQTARINSFFSLWLVPLILSGFGIVFFLAGSISFGFMAKKEKEKKWVKENGKSIQTELTDVSKNTSYKVNGRSPWVIRSQWTNPRTNKIHTFKSSNIWFDPTTHIQKVSSIHVKIDTRDLKKYWMDTDSVLPEAA